MSPLPTWPPALPPAQHPIGAHSPAQALTAPPPALPTAPGPMPLAPAPETQLPPTLSDSHAEIYAHVQAKKTQEIRKITKQDEEYFVREFIRTGNNEKAAAARIGLTEQQAWPFLKRKRVQELIRTWRTVGLSAQDITLDRTIRALGTAAFLDPIEVFDDDGKHLPLSQLPEHIRLAIATVHNPGYNGEAAKYTFVSKLDAQKTIAAILKPSQAAVTNTNITQNNTTQINVESLSIDDLKKMLHMQSNKPAEEPVFIDAEFE